jgi:hypothetical protein
MSAATVMRLVDGGDERLDPHFHPVFTLARFLER